MIDAVRELLGPGGALARALPDYEHRPQQLAMAEAVAAALSRGGPLLVEAGTGTGKTLAYLVPAALSGKKVVISTGTRALQEQIAAHDVPLLRDRLGLDVDAAVLKGISNYVCRRRLVELGDPDDPDLARIANWAAATTSGDRAELAALAEDAPAWRLVTTTPDARLGPRCPFYERCFVTQARRAATRAQLVIVNHHLFFADLALRAQHPGAAVLPPYDAVVFDEAHQIEDVATEHFGVGVSTMRFQALARDARKALGDGAAALLSNLEARADELLDALRARLLDAGAAAADGGRVAAPEDLFVAPARRERWFRLDAALEELAARAYRTAFAAADEGEAAAAIHRRAEAVRADLATLAEPPAAAAARHVRWGEVRGRAVLLHASPIDVGPLLREHVVGAVESAVFTSATLTAGGSFDYVRERLGLEPGDADELTVDSPFDFARQALLYLPRDLPAPQDPAFGDAALERALELLAITNGRAFVLFTSHRALRQAAAALRARRVPWPLLVQGDGPRPALLDAFRRDVGSVLLATASFWEGIDVPGEALSLVVIEKLPFAPPDDPLTAARSARVQERGVDPFTAYQLPRAALALKQGFGRLIRRRDDRGIVAILDHRIVTRAYGQTFLASLPPAARTSSLEQVRRWW